MLEERQRHQPTVKHEETNELLKAIIYEYKGLGQARTQRRVVGYTVEPSIWRNISDTSQKENFLVLGGSVTQANPLLRVIENRLSPFCLEVVDDVLFASIKAAYAGAIDLDDQDLHARIVRRFI